MSVAWPNKPTHRIDKERRVADRFQSFAEVWADPGGTALAIGCKVLDISRTGAKIEEIDGALPDDFTLHSSGLKYRAHVVWRRRTTIGVEFVDPEKPRLNPGPPKGAPERRQAAQDKRAKKN